MTVFVGLSPILNGWQGFLSNGLPNANGFIYTYEAGSTTPLETYTLPDGSVQNQNPIQLGPDGRPPQEIWLRLDSAYKLTVKDTLGTLVAEYDNIQALDVQNGMLNVQNFKLTSDTDDTSSFLRARDKAVSLGRAVILVPPAIYNLSTQSIITPANNIYWYTFGENATLIQRTGDYGDTFLFTGNDATGAVIAACGIIGGGVRIQNLDLMTHGAHIHCNGVTEFHLNRTRCANGFYNYQFSGLLASYLYGIHGAVSTIFGGTQTGRHNMLFDSAAATYGHPHAADVFLQSFDLSCSVAAGQVALIDSQLKVTCSDGIFAQNGHLGGGGITDLALYAEDATLDIGITEFTQVMCDASFSKGIHCKSSGGRAIRNVKLTGCDVRGAGSPASPAVGDEGWLIDAGTNIDDVEIVGGTFRGWGKEGMKLLAGTGFRFGDVCCRGNSTRSKGTYSGAFFDSVDKLSWSGGSSGWDNTDNLTRYHKYAIEYGNNCSDHLLGGGLDLTGNVTGQSISGGVNMYRTGDVALEGAPSAAILSNLIQAGGYHFDGANNYLDGNPLTGIADSKKFTLVMKWNFADAPGVTQEMLHATSSRINVARNTAGQLLVQAANAAAALILSQATLNAILPAGPAVIMVSVDLATPGSFQVYVNDVVPVAITSTTFTNDTINFSGAAEYAQGGTVTGTSLMHGDGYMIWLMTGTNIDFSVTSNRRKFFDRAGNQEWLGFNGTLPTGSQPILYHSWDDCFEWELNRGSASTAWTRHGTPSNPATLSFLYNRDLQREFTVTAAAHTVGRTVKSLRCNFAGTVTLTLPDPAANIGRQIPVLTMTNNTVVSASSNVVAKTGGAAGTAILAGVAGTSALLESDGTNWNIIL